MKIAVLYTCFNRKEKTLSSLAGLYEAVRIYNQQSRGVHILPTVFLTDDGCTDGTAEAIRESFLDRDIHILQGDGSLFWAGGMRFAWKEALKSHAEWDYYLLMNDDTDLFPTCFIELFMAQGYSKSKYGMEGVISGITCAKDNPVKITYGGDIIPNKINGRHVRLGRSSCPQMVDLTNANILLVPRFVVDKIGIFHVGFKHGRADNDYSMTARRNSIPVLITAGACGACDNDHEDYSEFSKKVIGMTQSERTAFFNHPIRCNSDYLLFIKRNMPARYPISWCFRMMLTYWPKLYFRINGVRGIK